jgi:uncharacterized protein (DUF58 family)
MSPHTGIRREAIIRALIALLGLALALAAALLSSVAREAGSLLATAVLATSALLLAAVVAVTTLPYLVRRVTASRVRYALEYQITKEGAVYLGFVLVIAIAALNTGNNLLFLIVSALLGAVVVSGVASAAQLRVLEIGANIPDQAFAQTEVPAHITVRNRSGWLPAFSVAVVSPKQRADGKSWNWEPTVFQFPRPAPGRKPWVRLRDLRLKRSAPPPVSPPILRQPVYFPYINPNGSAGAELMLYFEQRGRYAQNAFGISTRFPFSFLMKTRNVPLSRELIVYPKLERSEHFYEVLPLLSGEFEHHLRGRGHDLYLIRDYQPEDSARHVDWKSSAKTGTLKIREFAREEERRLRIVFDNPAPGEATPESYEKGVSLAASLAWYLSQDNAALSFAAQGLAENTVWAFLHYLALVEPVAEPSIIDSLPPANLFNLVLTWQPRGTIVASVWQSSYVLFLNS